MSQLKVIIGWSKEPSGKIAERLEWLLRRCLSGVETFRSQSMEKGIAWFSDIMKKLDEASVGLFCITPGNKNSVWMHWEAAILFAKLKSDEKRVCPVLFGLTKGELGEPLSALSATSRKSEDMRALIEDLNAKQISPAGKDVLDDHWTTYWPKFDEQIEEILKAPHEPAKPKLKPDKIEKMTEEILLLIRRNERGASLSHRSTVELAEQLGSYLVALGPDGPLRPTVMRGVVPSTAAEAVWLPKIGERYLYYDRSAGREREGTVVHSDPRLGDWALKPDDFIEGEALLMRGPDDLKGVTKIEPYGGSIENLI